MWDYKDVLKHPLGLADAAKPDGAKGGLTPEAVLANLEALVEETRDESAKLFDESADNISAVCIAFERIEPAN